MNKEFENWKRDEYSRNFLGKLHDGVVYTRKTPFGTSEVKVYAISGQIGIRPLIITPISYNGEVKRISIEFQDVPPSPTLTVEEAIDICNKSIEDFKESVNNM